jgi:hypothetical protein
MRWTQHVERARKQETYTIVWKGNLMGRDYFGNEEDNDMIILK